MELNQIISFVIAAIVFTAFPGTDTLYVISESVSRGVKVGLSISFGLCTGLIIHTIVAASGLALILQTSTLALTLIKYMGVAYILYLAFETISEKIPPNLASDKTSNTAVFYNTPINFLKYYQRGFWMNVLNPKVTLFFIAFLPQFVISNGYSSAWQMFLLGLIFIIQGIAVMSLFSVVSGSLKSSLDNFKVKLFLKWFKFLVLILMVVFLIFSK